VLSCSFFHRENAESLYGEEAIKGEEAVKILEEKIDEKVPRVRNQILSFVVIILSTITTSFSY